VPWVSNKSKVSLIFEISSSVRTRSVVFTPAKLPCGYVITCNADVKMVSGGKTQKRSYVQTLTVMDKSLKEDIVLLQPTQYICYDYRYDLTHTKQGQKYVPVITAMYDVCKIDDRTISDADDRVNQHLGMFTKSSTFDSVTTKVIEGKKYSVYSVRFKEPSGSSYVEVTVDDKKYINSENTTYNNGDETIYSYITYKYSWDYSKNDFALDKKRFPSCTETAYVAPAVDPCKH